MAKYLKALDHMSVAAQAYKAGKHQEAAKHMAAAVAHPTFATAMAVIDRFNDKQVQAMKLELAAKAKKKPAKKPAAKRSVKSAAWPFPVTAEAEGFSTDDNEELGIEVEENDDRQVQEADALEGDETELSLDDEESLESSAAEADEENDSSEEEVEEDVEQARFIRALHNARAQKTAASRLQSK